MFTGWSSTAPSGVGGRQFARPSGLGGRERPVGGRTRPLGGGDRIPPAPTQTSLQLQDQD